MGKAYFSVHVRSESSSSKESIRERERARWTREGVGLTPVKVVSEKKKKKNRREIESRTGVDRPWNLRKENKNKFSIRVPSTQELHLCHSFCVSVRSIHSSLTLPLSDLTLPISNPLLLMLVD